tara:strand:+ start:6045 stop:6554 length:510 start_codon:yes stop_codon:yes gene_type:complete
MGPETWGPHGWKFIHFITMAYPTHPSKYDKENYKRFFMDLAHVIPCSLCGDNYKDHLRMYPLDDHVLENQENLMEWGVKMHNLVNQSNDKKIYSNDEAFKLINEESIKDMSKCNNIKSNPMENNESTKRESKFIYLIVFILIAIFIACIYYKDYSKKYLSSFNSNVNIK